MIEALRIWLPLIVIIVMTLYLYDVGAFRVYDVLIATVAITVTSPIFVVLIVLSKIKKGRVFERRGRDLLFTYPNGKLAHLPVLVQIFMGERNFVPTRLKDFKL